MKIMRILIIDDDNDDDDDEEESNIDLKMYNPNCSYFLEYGGYEFNPTTPMHYPNQVVLYKLCKQ